MAEVYLGPPFHRGAETNVPPTRLVVHATAPNLKGRTASQANKARETMAYFRSPASGGSAHHVYDVGEGVRCAMDTTVCWHAPPNQHSLGYEICGETTYTRVDWVSPEVWPAVKLAAAAIRADALHYGIPLVKLSVADLLNGKSGICGHIDVSLAWHQTDHTDPGPGFPWDLFMAELTGTPAVPAPVTEEDIVATLDELRQVVREEIAAHATVCHAEHALLLHGDPSHPYNLDSIGKKVGVDPAAPVV